LLLVGARVTLVLTLSWQVCCAAVKFHSSWPSATRPPLGEAVPHDLSIVPAAIGFESLPIGVNPVHHWVDGVSLRCGAPGLRVVRQIGAVGGDGAERFAGFREPTTAWIEVRLAEPAAMLGMLLVDTQADGAVRAWTADGEEFVYFLAASAAAGGWRWVTAWSVDGTDEIVGLRYVPARPDEYGLAQAVVYYSPEPSVAGLLLCALCLWGGGPNRGVVGANGSVCSDSRG